MGLKKNVVFFGGIGGFWGDAQAVDPAVHEEGAWRFTAVTDRLIRIEYDTEQVFVDEPTDAFIRSPPSGKWVTEPVYTDDWASIHTASVTLRYMPGSAPSNGTVMVSNKDGFQYTWGDDPAVGNLGGTARTMDKEAETLDLNCHHKVSPTMLDNSQMECAWGLVSRAGWAVVNQTGMPMWKDDWYAPSRNSVDMFVFLHGLDFAGAMRDFAQAAGAPAVPPRYALGTMFSRWFNFDSDSVMNLVERFEEHTFPLDAWIFDMNWHQYSPKNKEIWGSYTWNSLSYPRRQELLDWMQEKGLQIGANTHDHDGIRTSEATYDEFCKALGRTQCTENITFDLYNKTYAMAQEDVAWRSLTTQGNKQGFDFAWIDYQQGEDDHFENTAIPNLNPTIVMNRLRSTDAARHGENSRGMILSRWGGYGNHRYPVGFSGDQKHDWTGLAFLPYFTSTAANVAYGYWSHDVVGGDLTTSGARDYELSVRWVQVSAWSPVLRFHDKGHGTGACASTDQCGRIIPWKLPEPFYEAVREAVWQREEHLPYIYTAALKAVETGLTLTRPMYYLDPADHRLYHLKHQYLFGDDMIISPITTPSGSNTSDVFEQALGAVSWSVHAPAGAGWVDRLNGDFGANHTLTNVYGINDVPGLVREGAVIPMKPKSRTGRVLARAQEPLSAVEFRIMPARAFYSASSAQMSSEGFVLDDDGVTTEYMQGRQSNTTCSYSFNGSTFVVSIRQTGDFSGRPLRTTVVLSFPQLPFLQLVTPASHQPRYDHELLGAVFTFRDVPLHEQGLDVVINFDPRYDHVRANFIGALGHLRQARYVKDALDVVNVDYGDSRANLTQYVLAATQMTPAFAETLPSLWDDAVKQVSGLLKDDKTLQTDARRSKFIAQMMGLEQHAAAAVDVII